MRIASLILCVIGVALSGFLAFKWYQQTTGSKDPSIQASIALLPLVEQAGGDLSSDPAIQQLKTRLLGWKILAGGALAGIIGIYFVMNFQGIIAGVLMIAPGAVMGYFDVRTFIFTGAMVLAGVFALFVWKKPKPEKKKKKSYAEDYDLYEDGIVEEYEDAVEVEEEDGILGEYKEEAEELPSDALVVEEEVKVKAKPKIPQKIDKFRCYSCSEILRTANPVPVGKKIRCPNCSDITKILPLET